MAVACRSEPAILDDEVIWRVVQKQSLLNPKGSFNPTIDGWLPKKISSFLVSPRIRCRNRIYYQKGPILLRTTHMISKSYGPFGCPLRDPFTPQQNPSPDPINLEGLGPHPYGTHNVPY